MFAHARRDWLERSAPFPLSLGGSFPLILDDPYIIPHLAAAFAAGPFEVEGLLKRSAPCLGRRPRWLQAAAREGYYQSARRTPPFVMGMARMVREESVTPEASTFRVRASVIR